MESADMEFDGESSKHSLRWDYLPMNIRLTILEKLTQKDQRLAPCASVCREWQAQIERKTFRRLRLEAPCLEEFQNISRHRRHLINHIWLNIELQGYDCSLCGSRESTEWAIANDVYVRDTITQLFLILCNWEKQNENLTLELSIQSNSDSKHWFRNCYFGTDRGDEVQKRERNITFDMIHHWMEIEQHFACPPAAILRLFATVLIPAFRRDLPYVRAVTTFILRRQTRRSFFGTSLRQLLSKLIQLECLIYEPWRKWDTAGRSIHDRFWTILLDENFPKTLKRISLFEDFNEDYIQIVRREMSVSSLRIQSPGLVEVFAARSLDLEQLYVSYMLDAWHFFLACRQDWAWYSLQSLVLTSSVLTREDPHDGSAMGSLLITAAKVALRMPVLHTMVLWNGGKGEACSFTYHKHAASGYSSITWRSTWLFRFLYYARNAWTMVASDYQCRLVVGIPPLLYSENINNHGDAIHLLNLPSGVIDPVSLQQIRREKDGFGHSGEILSHDRVL